MLTSNQPNHLSEIKPAPKRMVVWVFHDARPGHLSQLEGLSNRLSFHAHCEFHWFDITHKKLGVQHFLFFPDILKKTAKPDLIIAAGHSTHLSLLIAGLKLNAFTSVIMKPSLPLCFFDAVICPKHDNLKNSNRVFNTFGPINKIDQTQRNNTTLNKTLNLILIGGLSKHFHFDETSIIDQIKNICLKNTDTQWIVSNSPRTPQTMNKALTQLEHANLHFHDYQQGKLGPLQDILLKTKFTWITPDSMSMIFESLSAGSKVGLIKCEPKNNKRIVKQIRYLSDKGYLLDSVNNDAMNSLNNNLPWEADRAALWLLQSIKKRKHNESR